MQTRNSLTNLINRYKAVLKKCHILNTFGSLLIFSMLSLGVGHALMHPNMAVAASGVEDINTDGTASDASNWNYTLNTDISGDADPDAYGGRAKTTNATPGGDSQSATANGNTLTIDAGGEVQDAYGGYAHSQGGDGGGGIDGGDAGAVNANSNTLTINSGVNVGDSVYGGYAHSQGGRGDAGTGGAANLATANDNTLTINSGVDVDAAYGGYALSIGGNGLAGTGGNANLATANSNEFYLYGTAEYAYGGYADSSGGWGINGLGGDAGGAMANENELYVYGTVYDLAVGGYAESRGGQSNTVTGGAADLATASHNKLTINSGGTANQSAYGGYAHSEGGPSNTVTGGAGNLATASHNTLTINSGGTVTLYAYGGYARSLGGGGVTGGNAGLATANSNTLSISGTVRQAAYGGYAHSNGRDSTGANPGGAGGSATANSNTLSISGTVIGSSYGGYAKSEGGSGSSTGAVDRATASSNIVRINDATLGIAGNSNSGHVIGGVVFGNADSKAENNMVTLSGNVQFLNANNIVAGGLFNNEFAFSPHTNTFLGNSLVVDRYSGTNKIGTVGNFQNYSFILPKSTQNGATVLKVGTLYLNDGGAQSASVKNVSIEDGHSLEIGNKVILIDADTIHGTLANHGQKVSSDLTTFTKQEWQITQDTANHDIVAEFDVITPTEEAGQVSGAFGVPTLATIGMGTRTLVNSAIPAAAQAAQNNGGDKSAQAAASGFDGQGSEQVSEQNTNKSIAQGAGLGINAGSKQKSFSLAPFAVVQGGYNTYHTGSHVNVSSLSFVGGLAFTKYFNSGELMLGAFFEAGTGSYNSYSNVGNLDVNGHGYMDYFGGGIFARYEFYTKHGRPYVEASARLGALNYDYYTNDIADMNNGSHIDYDLTAKYYGLHFGGGYIWNINKQWELDLSAKYFWTHQEGNSAGIGGDSFDFDAINSNILKVGAKLSYDVIDNASYTLSPYVGLAYEYEFDGEARSSVNGVEIDDPASIGGGTGVLELGVSFEHANGLSLNLGAEGSLGQREGIMGKLEVKYEF